MDSIFKTLLALGLGLGFLVLDSQAQAGPRTTLAFLGIAPEADPLFGRALSTLIRQELAADSVLSAVPPRSIDEFLSKGAVSVPQTGPYEIALLRRGLEADYYAFGWLGPLTVSNARKWWLPWSVKTEWSRELRLRVLDGRTGLTVFDGQVPARIPEKHLFTGPDGDLSRKGAVERDGRQRRMLPILSSETAKALAKAVGEAANPENSDAGAAAGATENGAANPDAQTAATGK
jgi:hypothetical protein